MGTRILVMWAALLAAVLVGFLIWDSVNDDDSERVGPTEEFAGDVGTDFDRELEGVVEIVNGECQKLEVEIPTDNPVTFRNQLDEPFEIGFAHEDVEDITIEARNDRAVEFPGAGEYEFTCAGETGTVTVIDQ